GEQRLQALMILRLASGAERAERAAVEAVHHGDDFVAARLAVEPSQLDRRLDRFRAAVAEKALAAPAGPLAERLRELALFLRVPGVGDVNEPAHLLAHGGDHARRAMADQVATPTGEEIQITVAFGVPDVTAFAAHQANRAARVIGDDVLPKQIDR